MSLRETVVLELRVALSRTAQPVWVRLLKWAVIISAVVYYWRAPLFWWWVAGLAGLAASLHLLWRIKTKRWTQAWWGWNDIAATRPATRSDESP
jgi:hypothetical protein